MGHIRFTVENSEEKTSTCRKDPQWKKFSRGLKQGNTTLGGLESFSLAREEKEVMVNLYQRKIHPTSVDLLKESPFGEAKAARSPHHRRGQKYEEKAVEMLESTYGPQFIPGPWFQYFIPGDPKRHVCQMDGLLIQVGLGLITICEIKVRHTIQAWGQLTNLYRPVIDTWINRAARERDQAPWKIAVCEVVNFYDSEVQWPCHIRFRRAVHEVRETDEFAVHIFSPRHHFKQGERYFRKGFVANDEANEPRALPQAHLHKCSHTSR